MDTTDTAHVSLNAVTLFLPCPKKTHNGHCMAFSHLILQHHMVKMQKNKSTTCSHLQPPAKIIAPQNDTSHSKN